MTTPLTESLWTVSQRSTYPSLHADAAFDVVVIGAGVTGLTAALKLVEEGRSVAVLEARTVAGGVTGSTTAHLTEAIDARYAKIEASFGRPAAELVGRTSRAAIDHIATRIVELGIDCDWKRVPGYLYTERTDERSALVAELDAARHAGCAVTMDAPELPMPFEIVAALRFENQARLNAVAYVEGLARAAVARGVQIFEHSRVVDLDEGDGVTVSTEHGAKLSARAVFCATHVPLNLIFLQTKLAHYQSYVAAFSGIEGSMEDALFWDTAEPYHYIRRATVGGRGYLIVGGEDHKTGEQERTQVPFERLLSYARANFGTDRPDYHWSAQVVESVDGLPFIGRNSASTQVYVATGFGGNGITFGTAGALLVADLILGRVNPAATLFDATRMKASAAFRFVKENKDLPLHLVASLLQPAEVQSTKDIAPDQGRIMKIDGQRLAVYRDRSGALSAVSAVCTHMGCLVAFNEAERSWDCPCHGSRFTVEGEVIDGPALHCLKKCPIAEDDESEAVRAH